MRYAYPAVNLELLHQDWLLLGDRLPPCDGRRKGASADAEASLCEDRLHVVLEDEDGGWRNTEMALTVRRRGDPIPLSRDTG